jgi:asparagine N-glycosylation enzyme membrane subunit Stt3
MAHETNPSRVRRGFLWLFLLTASIVVVAVFVQAFSIAAYVRGAGQDALDLHKTVGFLTHSIEIIVFLAALGGYWGMWRRVGTVFLLPVIGTIQVFAIGDTNTSGGWINGLHGLLALVVLLFALALAESGRRSLGLGRAST